MSSPTVGRKYKANVVNISGTGNPKVQNDDWDYPVVILTPDEDFSEGDQVEFVVTQKMKWHYQARLPDREPEVSSSTSDREPEVSSSTSDREPEVSSPTFGRIYRGKVSENTTDGNPIVRHSDWDMSVVIITEDSETFSKGDQVKFVVKKKVGQRYQALLSHKAPVVKPHYGSKAVIPIHHDGKDNQSVGDTRSERHATRPVDERN